jgi:hypothetical protein
VGPVSHHRRRASHEHQRLARDDVRVAGGRAGRGDASRG